MRQYETVWDSMRKEGREKGRKVQVWRSDERVYILNLFARNFPKKHKYAFSELVQLHVNPTLLLRRVT